MSIDRLFCNNLCIFDFTKTFGVYIYVKLLIHTLHIHKIQIFLSSIDVFIGILDTIASTFLYYLHILEVKNINVA